MNDEYWIRQIRNRTDDELGKVNAKDYETTPEVVFHATQLWRSVLNGGMAGNLTHAYGTFTDRNNDIHRIHIHETAQEITLSISAIMDCVNSDDFPSLVMLLAKARIEKLLQGD